MAKVLREVDQFHAADGTLVAIWLVQVDRDELVADFRREFTIVNLGELDLLRSEKLIFVTLLLQLAFVIISAVVLLALVFSPLTPPMLVQAVCEH